MDRQFSDDMYYKEAYMEKVDKIKEVAWDCVQAHIHKYPSFTNEEAREEVENIMYGVEDLIAKEIQTLIAKEIKHKLGVE